MMNINSNSCARHKLAYLFMKKIIMIMCLLFSMGISNVLGQEVRGVETKRVKYNGSQYEYATSRNKNIYSDDYTSFSSEYYGWELHNANSISVAVDIELWKKIRDGERLEMTKSVVLKPSEKYIFKFEGYEVSHCNLPYYDNDSNIEDYYIKYKAFKLE